MWKMEVALNGVIFPQRGLNLFLADRVGGWKQARLWSLWGLVYFWLAPLQGQRALWACYRKRGMFNRPVFLGRPWTPILSPYPPETAADFASRLWSVPTALCWCPGLSAVTISRHREGTAVRMELVSGFPVLSGIHSLQLLVVLEVGCFQIDIFEKIQFYLCSQWGRRCDWI